MKPCKVNRVAIAKLKPAKYNPRSMSAAARAGLAASIERFGLVQPIVWNKTSGNVVGGHRRLEILIANGETSADVVVVELRGADEKALNVTLNNQALAGEWTEDLAALLREIGETTPHTLYDDLLLSELCPREDAAETVDTSSQLGGLEFRIVVDCRGEAHQAELLARFEGEGLPCRPLMS